MIIVGIVVSSIILYTVIVAYTLAFCKKKDIGMWDDGDHESSWFYAIVWPVGWFIIFGIMFYRMIEGE